MPRNSATCRDCGLSIALVPFQPDHARPSRTPRDSGTTSWVPLDVKPVPDDNSNAPYAASRGLTYCHLITETWPLIYPERRHTVHYQTCPARNAAATTPGDTDDDD